MAKNQADKITEAEIPEITEAEIFAKTLAGLSRAQALEVLENQRAHDKALRL